MGWNKEKLVFLASLVVGALVIFSTIPAWRTGGTELSLTAPTAASRNIPLGPVQIDWFRADTETPGRDPFGRASSWREPVADPLPIPELGALYRRVPLPQPLADSGRARPSRERTPPEEDEAQ